MKSQFKFCRLHLKFPNIYLTGSTVCVCACVCEIFVETELMVLRNLVTLGFAEYNEQSHRKAF